MAINAAFSPAEALTNNDVKIKIVKNKFYKVDKVNYEKVGTYDIYYSVSDAEGKATAK